MNDKNKKERRHGPDKWIFITKYIGIICWFLFILTVFLADKSKPRMETFFDRLLNVDLRKNWDLVLLDVSFYVTLTMFYLAGLGLIINTRRHKRKSDKYNRTLIFLILASLISIIIYIYYLV
ncbi:MAG: hypothetical protein KAI43_11400 [Candidatus Aureabacteria bacterium]|nr:hypothetical protein [Candidatus Auribacterota bacterium]